MKSRYRRMDDERLAGLVGAGDGCAFEALYDRHHGPLLAFCRHMLGNRDDGEDALQQAFLRAHQALAGGRAPDRVRPWLFAIARNRCLTLIAARREAALPADDIEPSFDGLAADVERRADLRELVSDLGRLPVDQREALVLAELGDLSHPDIARVIGCSPAKVKALVFQARTTLIAERDARRTPCDEIRTLLDTARAGLLRRGALRRHLRQCDPCAAYRVAIERQRTGLALVLPVAPTAGLKAAVLAGAGGLGAGGAETAAAARRRRPRGARRRGCRQRGRCRRSGRQGAGREGRGRGGNSRGRRRRGARSRARGAGCAGRGRVRDRARVRRVGESSRHRPGGLRRRAGARGRACVARRGGRSGRTGGRDGDCGRPPQAPAPRGRRPAGRRSGDRAPGPPPPPDGRSGGRATGPPPADPRPAARRRRSDGRRVDRVVLRVNARTRPPRSRYQRPRRSRLRPGTATAPAPATQARAYPDPEQAPAAEPAPTATAEPTPTAEPAPAAATPEPTPTP